MESIRNNEAVDRSSYNYKEIEKIVDLYTGLKWCPKYNNELKQMESLLISLKIFEVEKDKIIKQLIELRGDVKEFLVLHSILPVNAKHSEDWLVRLMADCLYMSDDEIEDMFGDKQIPDEISNLMGNEFEMIDFELESIRIEYGSNEKDSNNRIKDPINIIDTGWEDISKGAFNASEFIGSFEVIDMKTFVNTKYNNVKEIVNGLGDSYFDDYDLPF